jgi:hypothetical protein
VFIKVLKTGAAPAFRIDPEKAYSAEKKQIFEKYK